MRGSRSAIAGVLLGLLAFPAAAGAETADLAVTVHPDGRNQVRIGQQVRITVTVVNNGPDAAPVFLSTLTPDSLIVTGVECPGGVVVDVTNCEFPPLPSGRRVHAKLTATVMDWPIPSRTDVAVDAYPTTSTGGGTVNDPNTANNHAAWSATITR